MFVDEARGKWFGIHMSRKYTITIRKKADICINTRRRRHHHHHHHQQQQQ
jgi:hypothetical protein